MEGAEWGGRGWLALGACATVVVVELVREVTKDGPISDGTRRACGIVQTAGE